jgi:hypothetical protein
MKKESHPFCSLQCRVCKKHNGYADREYGDGTTICRRCVKAKRLDNWYAIAKAILSESITGIEDAGGTP